jgi:hypothetical protein
MTSIKRVLVLLLLISLALTACGGDPEPSQTTTAPTATPGSPAGSPPGGDVDLTGEWNGTYGAGEQVAGTFTIEFEQTGNQVTGTIDIQGSPCVSHGDISGALSGNQITFGAVEAEQSISFTGEVSGDHMSGDFAAPECEAGTSGDWEADRA